MSRQNVHDSYDQGYERGITEGKLLATKDEKCKGLSNRETWLADMWLRSYQPMYDYWKEQAKRLGNDERALSMALKDEYRDHILNIPMITNEPSIFRDLLQCAFNRVNWLEIAEKFLED